MAYALRERSLEEIHAENIAFNKSLNIPVRWKSAYKVRWRSGKGSYDYRSGNTHQHVLLLEDLLDGRLRRKAGQFLCGCKITDPYMHKMWNLAATDDEAILESYKTKVSCPKCIRLAKRWQAK